MQQQSSVKAEPASPALWSGAQLSGTPTGTSSSMAMTHQNPLTSQPKPETAEGSVGDASADGAELKPWKKHKSPGFKVNKVLKRRRQNARFRKLLVPKNAIMILNELQPGLSFDAEESTNAFSQLTYTVKLNIDGTTYNGEGPSKSAAKAAAAELAVKGLILKKITESSMKKASEGAAVPAADEDMDTASGDDVSEKDSVNGKRVIPEDEVPWGSLASYALFKLFADWKAQGSNIPSAIISTPPSAPKLISKALNPKPQTAAPGKGAVPENPELLHPVTLVGRLHHGTLFREISREGNPPHLTFCIGATVNGTDFVGTAKNKKEAKKNCAIEILKASNIPYNTNV